MRSYCSGMDRVAERIEARARRAGWGRRGRRCPPECGTPQTRVAVPYALGVLAEWRRREAVAADAAHDVAFAVDEVAGLAAVNVGADRLDNADKLVADDHGRLDCFFGPSVPVVDVDVGAADGSFLHLDQDVVDSRRGHGNLHEIEPRSGAEFGDGAHGLHGASVSAGGDVSSGWRVILFENPGRPSDTCRPRTTDHGPRTTDH